MFASWACLHEASGYRSFGDATQSRMAGALSSQRARGPKPRTAEDGALTLHAGCARLRARSKDRQGERGSQDHALRR
jgi:hypothetical protein